MSAKHFGEVSNYQTMADVDIWKSRKQFAT